MAHPGCSWSCDVVTVVTWGMTQVTDSGSGRWLVGDGWYLTSATVWLYVWQVAALSVLQSGVLVSASISEGGARAARQLISAAQGRGGP